MLRIAAIFVLLVSYAAAAQTPSVNDRAVAFGTELWNFVVERDHAMPPGPMRSEDLDSVLAKHREETMRLFDRNYRKRCTDLANELGDKELAGGCGAAHHPQNIGVLSMAFKKKGKQ